MANYGVYVPYESLKQYIGVEDVEPKDDPLLKRFAEQASRAFDAFCRGRHFFPIKAVRYYDHPSSNGVNELRLDEDLLEVTSLTTQNGSTTITSGNYYLMAGPTYNQTPYDRVCLKTDSTQSVFLYSGTIQQANALTGIWGYHDRWATDAWLDSQDTVQDNPITAAATTLTVSDLDAKDLFDESPRFQIQQLIRIEDEYLYITDKNPSNNTLTVIRGVNGTTAASHVQNTQIDIFQPMPDIVEAMQAFGAYVYRRKDSIGSAEDRPLASSTGLVIQPSTLPGEVKDMLKVYKRWS